MKVGITGASGFIGQHLIRRLRVRGHKAVVFTREGGGRAPASVSTRPFPKDDPPDLRGLDALVNLAGESILGWWTKGKKQRIRESRVGTARRLAASLTALPTGKGPRVLVSASATGFYGDRGEEVLDETRDAGTGFLADVCREWEDAARTAEKPDLRIARLRSGVVVGRDGGSFALQRKIFGAGLGGRLGDGRQWISPIHIDDLTGLIVFLLERDEVAGPFNAVCPQPIRNGDFTVAVARALHKPAVLPAPAFALRALLGESSRVLLDSARVVPTRALAAGYVFRFPTPEAIVADVCAPEKAPAPRAAGSSRDAG